MERYRVKTNGVKAPIGPGPGKLKRYVPKDPATKKKMGRPVGAKNKVSEAIREKMAEEGDLPHVFALKVSRLPVGAMLGDHKITWEDIKWAAQLAAPYFAARQVAAQITGANGGPIPLQQVLPDLIAICTNEELLVMEGALKKMGIIGSTLRLTDQSKPQSAADRYAAMIDITPKNPLFQPQ